MGDHLPRFTARHYVPILTWKQAEQRALQSVPAATRAGFTPLLQIIPIPADLDDGTPTKTFDDHIDGAIEKIVQAWGSESEFFLDPRDVADEEHSQTQLDGSAHVYQVAAGSGLPFVPVTGIYRSAANQAAALAHRQRGVCIRLTLSDFNQQNAMVALAGFVANAHLTEANVDLILDLASVAQMQQFVISTTMTALLARIPNIAAWRTITIAGCSFPSLAGVSGTNTFDRSEWLSWLGLYATRATMTRMPSFGDYVVQSPDAIEGYDPRYMPMTPAIRYTLSTEWLVIRGQSSKTQALSTQFPVLAGTLLNSGHFYGANHCDGCSDAAACANGMPKLGSTTVWRRIGTAHHLHVVTAQAAALPAP